MKTVAVVTGYFVAHQFLPPVLTYLNKLTFILIGIMIFLVNTIICLWFIASHLLKHWQENSLRTAQLEKEKIQVQLDSLKKNAYFHRDELIYLYTTDGRKLVTDYRTLDELDELVDPVRFFRANRQFLISVGVVAGYQPHFSGKLAVRLQSPFESVELLISKEKAATFRQWLES